MSSGLFPQGMPAVTTDLLIYSQCDHKVHSSKQGFRLLPTRTVCMRIPSLLVIVIVLVYYRFPSLSVVAIPLSQTRATRPESYTQQLPSDVAQFSALNPIYIHTG